MELTERHDFIVERLRRDGRVDVADLTTALRTSEVTVRRDLDLLADGGVLRRVRGGAISLMKRGEELPYALRAASGQATKHRLAVAVAARIQDGEAVAIDSGTTGDAAARALVDRRLTAMPLSLHAAMTLSTGADITLLLPGGSVRHGEGTFIGPTTEASLSALRFDTLILTCCGAGPDAGITAHDVQDAAVKRAAIAASARTILIAEAAKFSRTALAVVCPLDAIDLVITEATLDDAVAVALRESGLEVERV